MVSSFNSDDQQHPNSIDSSEKKNVEYKKVNVSVKSLWNVCITVAEFFLHYQILVGGPIVKEDYAFSTPIYWVEFVFSSTWLVVFK